jgi:hypothetical protein
MGDASDTCGIAGAGVLAAPNSLCILGWSILAERYDHKTEEKGDASDTCGIAGNGVLAAPDGLSYPDWPILTERYGQVPKEKEEASDTCGIAEGGVVHATDDLRWLGWPSGILHDRYGQIVIEGVASDTGGVAGGSDYLG